MTTHDQARDQFRAIVAEADACTNAGDEDGANTQIAKLERLVQEQGSPVELLQPLVEPSESPEVRFNAASALLSLGAPELGLRTLDALDAEDSSIASVKARTVASYWRRQNT